MFGVKGFPRRHPANRKLDWRWDTERKGLFGHFLAERCTVHGASDFSLLPIFCGDYSALSMSSSVQVQFRGGRLSSANVVKLIQT
jgi:hypothetical protein